MLFAVPNTALFTERDSCLHRLPSGLACNNGRSDCYENEWNENDGRNEGFEIRDIRGYRKRGNRREYLVEYEPRVLEADIEFPEELPAVNGRPWDLVDWVTTTELGRRIGKDIVLRKRMEWYRLMDEIKKRVVGAQGVVVGEDVGGILEG
mgnify:CR=1 FL=1